MEDNQTREEFINVSSKKSTRELANLILEHMDADSYVELRAIGAGAVNQAIKGIAVAQQRLQEVDPTDFYRIRVGFFNVIIDGQEKSGISLEVREVEV